MMRLFGKSYITRCKDCKYFKTTGVDVKGQDGMCCNPEDQFLRRVYNEDSISETCLLKPVPIKDWVGLWVELKERLKSDQSLNMKMMGEKIELLDPDEERYNAIGHVQYIMSELEGD